MKKLILIIFSVMIFCASNNKFLINGFWVINPNDSSNTDYIEILISNKEVCINETHVGEIRTSFELAADSLFFGNRGYSYSKLNDDKILIHFGNDKLVFDREMEYCPCEDFSIRWIKYLKKYDLMEEDNLNQLFNAWLMKWEKSEE